MPDIRNISPDQLAAICRGMKQAKVNHFTPLVNQAIQSYKIPYGALPEFLSNVAHESGEFTIKAENMNYTTPQRLVDVWLSRFSITGGQGKHKAADFAGNPRKLANEVYNGRMGNKPGSDDGFNFRGGGFAQITGREAYALYASFINMKHNTNYTVEEIATLVQTEDVWAMDSAAWFFCEFKNLEQLAIEDRFKDLVKRWNGGYIGLPDRLKYYERAKASLT